jgi:hypothetical protein
VVAAGLWLSQDRLRRALQALDAANHVEHVTIAYLLNWVMISHILVAATGNTLPVLDKKQFVLPRLLPLDRWILVMTRILAMQLEPLLRWIHSTWSFPVCGSKIT